MAKRLFISWLWIFLFTQFVFVNAGVNKECSSKSVPLQGTLVTGTTGVKSAPVTPALPSVVATLYATSLKIEFNGSLGSLTVTVTDQYGVPVFQQTVNATAGSSMAINTLPWSSGAYTLLITNTGGGRLEGGFVK